MDSPFAQEFQCLGWLTCQDGDSYVVRVSGTRCCRSASKLFYIYLYVFLFILSLPPPLWVCRLSAIQTGPCGRWRNSLNMVFLEICQEMNLPLLYLTCLSHHSSLFEVPCWTQLKQGTCSRFWHSGQQKGQTYLGKALSWCMYTRWLS